MQIYFRMKAAENLAAFKSELVEAVKEEKVRIDWADNSTKYEISLSKFLHYHF